MSTLRVTAEILTVHPHPNADALELAQVGLYRAVVAKGAYRTGDAAVYIPEQSVLPAALIDELGLTGRLAGGNHDRVKAAAAIGSVEVVCRPGVRVSRRLRRWRARAATTARVCVAGSASRYGSRESRTGPSRTRRPYGRGRRIRQFDGEVRWLAASELWGRRPGAAAGLHPAEGVVGVGGFRSAGGAASPGPVDAVQDDEQAGARRRTRESHRRAQVPGTSGDVGLDGRRTPSSMMPRTSVTPTWRRRPTSSARASGPSESSSYCTTRAVVRPRRRASGRRS
ncbi:hypothetical protein SALBM217S_03204 [Streptomyces griseoloalbus]